MIGAPMFPQSRADAKRRWEAAVAARRMGTRSGVFPVLVCAATVGTVARLGERVTINAAPAPDERGECAMFQVKSLLSVAVVAAAAMTAAGCSVHTTARPARVVVHETRPAAKVVVNRPAPVIVNKERVVVEKNVTNVEVTKNVKNVDKDVKKVNVEKNQKTVNIEKNQKNVKKVKNNNGKKKGHDKKFANAD
jgi:hypothetical protein